MNRKRRFKSRKRTTNSMLSKKAGINLVRAQSVARRLGISTNEFLKHILEHSTE